VLHPCRLLCITCNRAYMYGLKKGVLRLKSMGSRPGNRQTRLNSWMERTGQKSNGHFSDKMYFQADSNQSSNLFNAQDLSKGKLIYQDEKSKTYLFVEPSEDSNQDSDEEEMIKTGEDTGTIWNSDYSDVETEGQGQGEAGEFFPGGSRASISIGGLNAGLLEKGDFSKVNYWSEAATGQSTPRLEALLVEMNNHLEGIEKVLEQLDSHLQVHLSSTPTPVKSTPLLERIAQRLKSLLKG